MGSDDATHPGSRSLRTTIGTTCDLSTLDPGVTKDFIQVSRASALKFLALWNADDDSAERADLVSSFIELAHSAGVPAVVEGIVRHSAGSWSSVAARDDAIVAAAAELSALGADLYKAEVPGDPMHLETIEEGAKRITEAVPCAWVVLSNGVPPDVFADAVEAACAGGASGFLAGRAIWTSAARSADPSEALGSDSVARFRAVDERVPARSPATR
jgi:sulfofructosephosphate aldolase